ncbi:glycosyltransferase [Sesbania bispinosa]|nr:glycosyltransferase [Sesbania bispinosa]
MVETTNDQIALKVVEMEVARHEENIQHQEEFVVDMRVVLPHVLQRLQHVLLISGFKERQWEKVENVELPGVRIHQEWKLLRAGAPSTENSGRYSTSHYDS